MIKNICVITPGYPSKKKPFVYTFVDQLVCAIADKGIKVTVITPYDILKNKSISIRIWERKTPGGNKVKIYSPSALTLTTRKVGLFNFSVLSDYLFTQAVLKTIKKYKISADVFYSHFLFPAGVCASEIGKMTETPSVCAFGESSLWSIREIGIENARKKLSNLTGVVAVSTNNKNVLVNNKLIDESNINVIPNAVNKKIFSPGNKMDAREKLGLSHDCIIGLFNGAFKYSKGSLRVNEASKGIEGLSMVYLGGGVDEPNDSNILFKGRVAHKDVTTWLKAADFFVLPTLEEGCCNAIVEAMSVGLPIITSDLPFNYDILDSESALLIDPLDIEQLHNAMKQLTISSALRKKYSDASLQKSKNLDINIRADHVIDYLNLVQKKYISSSSKSKDR